MHHDDSLKQQMREKLLSRKTKLTTQLNEHIVKTIDNGDPALLGDKLSIEYAAGASLRDGAGETRRTKTISDDLHPAGLRLVPRGQRFHLLMSLAVAGHKNGVERAAILAILEATNSEYCNPPKTGAKLQKIVGWAVEETTASCRPSGFDGQSPGLIPRGERHAFLMVVASACHERGVEREATFAIAKMINSEWCAPPKAEKELNEIVDWTARNHYSRGRVAVLEIGAHGGAPPR